MTIDNFFAGLRPEAPSLRWITLGVIVLLAAAIQVIAAYPDITLGVIFAIVGCVEYVLDPLTVRIIAICLLAIGFIRFIQRIVLETLALNRQRKREEEGR